MIKKIKNKILLLVLVSIMISVIPIGILQLYFLNKNANEDLKNLKTVLLSDYDKNVKNQVYTAVSILDEIYKGYEKNLYSFDEAKKTGASLLRNMTYGNHSYFWADTKEGICIVYLGTKTEGINRYNQKDSQGKYLFHEINKKACNGGGFTNYWFPRPGTTEPKPKRSYSLYFEPFNWVIGTGNYIDDINKIIHQKELKNKSNFRKSLFLLFIIETILLFIVVLLSLIWGLKISNPLINAIQAIKKISKKELNFKIDKKRDDEIGELYNAINDVIGNFKELLIKINKTSVPVYETGESLALISQQIAQSSNEQAATTEELSASIDDMVTTITFNTDNAEKTNKKTSEAAKKIMQIKELILKTLESVEKIDEKIIVVSEIARKTHLLSINASIQAATSGNLGFDVIAQEIRKLAVNTSKASEEIENFAKENKIIAENTSAEFEKLVPKILESADDIKNIAEASRKQNENAQSINSSIIQLAQLANENSSSVEEMAVLAEELSNQAEILQKLIAIFKVSN